VKTFAIDCWDTNQLDWVQEWNDTNSIPPMLRVDWAPAVVATIRDDRIRSAGNGGTALLTMGIIFPSFVYRVCHRIAERAASLRPAVPVEHSAQLPGESSLSALA